MIKYALSAALVLSATAAFAQSGWYIVQDTKTKRCTIVSERPTVKTTVIVNPDGTVYKTRTEAETGLKTIKVCEVK
jgi:hypothetical protein